MGSEVVFYFDVAHVHECLLYGVNAACAPGACSQRHWRLLVHLPNRLWEHGRGRQADLWTRGVRWRQKSHMRVRSDTGKIPFGHSISLARWLVTLLKKKCMNAPTQWTVSCDAGGAFGAVSSCYPLKCTVPSLTLSFQGRFLLR